MVVWVSMGSAMMRPTRQRGFRLAYGSWKIICRRLRMARPPDSAMPARGWPSKRISPRVRPYSPTSMRATVDLPQPDSPTSASVSPRAMSKDTPSTARSMTLGLPDNLRSSHGGDTSNQRAASRTSTNG